MHIVCPQEAGDILLLTRRQWESDGVELRRDQKRPQEESDGFGSWNHNNHSTVRALQALVASSSTLSPRTPPSLPPHRVTLQYTLKPLPGLLGKRKQLNCDVLSLRGDQGGKKPKDKSKPHGKRGCAADITHPRHGPTPHTNAHTHHATLAEVLFATSSVSSESPTPATSTNLLQH